MAPAGAKEDHPSTTSETDDQAFSRLARLSPPDYERARRAEAKRLGLRIGVLDSEVERVRTQLQIEADSRAVHIGDVVPWPDPVTGAEVLDQVFDRYNLYLSLPPGAGVAMALWTPHPYALGAFHISPRLSLRSDTGGCGKTTALDVMHAMLPRVLRAENLSAAVLFRIIHEFAPTVLLDEVDTYLYQSDELRGVTNAGHKRGSHAYRCEGENRTVRAFIAHCRCVLAGVGDLPPTLRDRSIVISLVAAPAGNRPAAFDPLNTEIENILARKIARWIKDNVDALVACKPALPPIAFNRLADNWRPLFTIAQIAGGHWPELAIDAFDKLAPRATSPDLDLALLADITEVFKQSGSPRLFSSALVDSLCALPDRPWPKANQGGAPITGKWLVARLKSAGIPSRRMLIAGHRAVGYHLDDITKAMSALSK